jgi:arylsulfatase A-like enzyme
MLGGTAAALMAPQLGRAAESAAEKPNVVFIFADDLGAYDVSWRGSEIKTPNLDALARSGARFEQFYVQPVCSPTRAALMTGRYPMRHGLQTDVVRPWAQYGLPLEERTLPQALREAGYETAICGKWHLGHFRREYLPTQRGFDHQYGHYNGALDYFTHVRDGGLDWHRDDKVCRDEGYTTHLIAREAVRLIRERDRKKPLFLYVAFNAVHAPHQVPEDYKKPYASLPEPRQTYAGMLAAMDEAVGQIVAAVDAQGLRKNTLFVFCSDNGGPAPGRVTNNGPLRAAKATLYEGGVRVVGCAAWEGRLKPGGVVNEPFHIVDWYPTLLKLAGASLDQPLPLDGRDVWATIAEGAPSPHEEILINTAPRNGAIRVGNWKLILNGEVSLDEGGAAPKPKKAGKKAAAKAGASPPVELFDLAADPNEKTNLADQNPEVVKKLRARYDALAREAVPPKSKPQPADYKAPAVWGESD